MEDRAILANQNRIINIESDRAAICVCDLLYVFDDCSVGLIVSLLRACSAASTLPAGCNDFVQRTKQGGVMSSFVIPAVLHRLRCFPACRVSSVN